MRALLLMLAATVATPAAHADPLTLEQAHQLLGTQPDCDIPCLIAARYAKDDKAKAVALALFDATGDLAGVGVDETVELGYRGKIHLVPELPIAKYRQHLAWVSAAMTGIEGFFAALYKDEKTQPKYRWRDVAFRFVRSVGKRTPSAWAGIAPGGAWSVEYNVEGSLLTSDAGVLETLFHELFHINDEDHKDWSGQALRADYRTIVGKCGTKLACLTPYAPNKTVVRGGTYYAFQPNNGDTVHEYAAELAVRYFTEQREMLGRGKLSKPAFKCGPAQNGRAWQALIDEFFAGRDLVPACPSP